MPDSGDELDCIAARITAAKRSEWAESKVFLVKGEGDHYVLAVTVITNPPGELEWTPEGALKRIALTSITQCGGLDAAAFGDGWAGRIVQDHILSNWRDLSSGDVIDARHIQGRSEPAPSQAAHIPTF